MYNKLSKGMVMAITIGLAVSLTSCTSSPEATDGDRPFEGVTINVLMNQHAPTEDFRDKFLADFEDQTGMTVNLDIVPESGLATRTNLALSQASGQYDVIESGAKSWPQLVASDWLLPLDEYLADPGNSEYVEGFSPTLLKSLSNEGNTYGMPLFVGGNMLYYNKAMFKEAGLDPNSPPESMSELVEYAEKLNAPDKGHNGVVFRGTREGNANSFSYIMFWLLNGGRWENAQGEAAYTGVMTEPPAIETAEQWAQLAEYAPEGIANYSFNEAQLAMQQGQVAMWMDGAELGPALEDPAESAVAGDIGYHVIPGVGDDYVAGSIWGYSIAKDSKQQDAAWEFIKYATGTKVGVEQAVSGANAAPARTDVLSDPAVRDVLNNEYLDALEAVIGAANPYYSPMIPEGAEIRAAMSLGLSEILSGADPVGAMKAVDKEIEKIVGD